MGKFLAVEGSLSAITLWRIIIRLRSVADCRELQTHLGLPAEGTAFFLTRKDTFGKIRFVKKQHLILKKCKPEASNSSLDLVEK